jgi:type I restriction enzyme, S subunit
MNQDHSSTITNSQLKEGYKQTEVGVIPQDWEITSLDSVAKLSSGTTPARVKEERYFRNGTYYWVKTTDLNNSRITKTEEKITKAALDETCLQMYPPGTVLVAMYGGFNQIGRTGLIQISAAVNQALVAIQANPRKLDPTYLLVNLNYRVEYWKLVASSSRKDPNITSQDIRNFLIPLPPLAEQEAIANTLSDIDALIESLDRLLTKKRQIKQGAMQELLRSKDGWVVKRLGEICEIGMGRTPPRLNGAFWGKGYKWLSIADLKSKVVNESKEEITSLAAVDMKIIPKGTLLMSFKLSLGRLCFDL